MSKTSKTQQIAFVGIDLAKRSFHVYAADEAGHQVLSKQLTRARLPGFIAQLPACTIAMEACGSAHYWARELRALGHGVELLPAQHVKGYARGQKNDYNDAEAIAEAALRPNLKLVKEKTQEQLDLQACHRVRSRLVSRRTATINQIRAFLIEHGIAIRTGANSLRRSLPEILLQRADELSPRMRVLIEELHGDWLRLDARIEALNEEIEEISRQEKSCQNLMTIPGVGPLISTATVAAIGNGEAFERGRDFGAWLGLVPRQYSTGGKPILGRISKRGSKYLRTLFIQAANVILMRPQNWPRYSFGGWLVTAATRLHRNKLATALANKLARIAWSVLRYNERFDDAQTI